MRNSIAMLRLSVRSATSSFDPAPEGRAGIIVRLQIENGSADVVDGRLKIIDSAGEAFDDFGRSGARDGALQIHAGGEQALDDVIVQVVRDTLAVGEDGEFVLAFAGVRQCQCHRGVAGEVADEVKVAVIERGLALVACHRDDAEHGVVGAQRHDDRRALTDIGERLNGTPEIRR